VLLLLLSIPLGALAFPLLVAVLLLFPPAIVPVLLAKLVDGFLPYNFESVIFC